MLYLSQYLLKRISSTTFNRLQINHFTLGGEVLILVEIGKDRGNIKLMRRKKKTKVKKKIMKRG